MTDETISFNEARAKRENDGRLWTPLECLKAVVRKLESGEMEPVDVVYIAMARGVPEGVQYPWYSAGASAMEVKGLLAQHLHDTCAVNVADGGT